MNRLFLIPTIIAYVSISGFGPPADDVSVDSLRATVRFLSIDPATGLSRTRFVLRESEMRGVADSLAARLERSTGIAPLRLPFSFTKAYPAGARDSSYTAENIAVRLPGRGDGAVLLTAHYDCISLETPGWSNSWQTSPSPGADDNATGVAAIMEAARVLKGLDLPFAVIFVLFSAEEFDKLGSIDFVSRFAGLFSDRIIGVLNCDMLGFRLVGSEMSGCLLSNYNSAWLSDMIVEATSAGDPSLALRTISPGPSNYDHGAFWAHEPPIPAVTITELLLEDGIIANPFYHRLDDTLGTISFAQVERLTRLMTGFVSGLAAGATEIALLPSDLLIVYKGYITGRRAFRIGDTLTVLARARNMGQGPSPPNATGLLRVSIENGRGAKGIYAGAFELPPTLGTSDARIPVILDESFAGENVISASIVIAGMEDDPDNNAARERFAVEGKESIVLMHAFQPNPITGPFPSASFCVNLGGPAELNLELYNIEGERLATADPGARWGGRLGAGLNCVPCSQLFPDLGRLSSGVYLYRLGAVDSSGRRVSLLGRFAVQD